MGSTTAAATAAGAALLAACKMDSRTEPVASEPSRGRAPPLERDIDRIVSAQRTSDGAGVRLNRALGGGAPSMLDPFLLLDESIEDAMVHKDSVGNRGRLVSGSAQWTTAGHGIVHSEMLKQERGLMWSFQLWVNPAARAQDDQAALPGHRARAHPGDEHRRRSHAHHRDVRRAVGTHARSCGASVERAQSHDAVRSS